MTDERKLEIIEELFNLFDTGGGGIFSDDEVEVLQQGLDSLFMSITQPKEYVKLLIDKNWEECDNDTKEAT